MLVGQTIGSGAYRFEIESELGSGAMGTVYRARFHKDDKVTSVALKVVALGLLGNEGAMARFEREANILKQLRHPHIVRLYASGHYRKTPFIAMEFIDGEALDRVLARRGRLSWEEVVTYAKHLCEALQYAHDKGIIHRDLKPSNLMLGRDGILKLTDFGIAKDTDVTALTGMNSTIGTAAYMSPEQCKGDKNLSNKSDLYSLGVVFFELLSGRKPFTADTTVDMFLKHVNEIPPRIGKIVQDLPPRLDLLIHQLLEKDKDDRPRDAAWVGRMLEEIEVHVFARKSAGLDAVSARKVDRPRTADDIPISEEDREAARILKGVAKKKKKKKPSLPWHQRKWVKAVGILAALFLMVGVVYFVGFRVPSADTMFKAMLDAKTPETRFAAAEAYLRQYGDRPGEQTDAAAREFRAWKIREREKQLVNRFGNALWRNEAEGDDIEIYKDAMTAIQAEKEGRLADAVAQWGKVRDRAKEKYPEDAKLAFTFDDARLAKARWGWIADKRIKDIETVSVLLAQLGAKIDENRRFEKSITFDPASAESLAIKAIRLERVKDIEKAGRLWEAITVLTEKDPGQHEWLLLANERRGKLPKELPENASGRRQHVHTQVEMIAKRNAELKAASGQPADWIALRSQCREIIDLYEDETDKTIEEDVKTAKRILAEAEKQR
jgi:serine/threonine-protein kinase